MKVNRIGSGTTPMALQIEL